jgi:two-component system NtrC family sensor kinase
VTTKEREGFVDVSFKDTGVGIPRGNIQKIFDPLFTTKAKGQGLGLSTAKRIVEIQGGTIIVESGKGGGSTFTVRLPINPTNLELDGVPEA